MAPRIFVSEIDETKLSLKVQHILDTYLDKNDTNFNFDNKSKAIQEHDYNTVLKESEYTGWTLLNGNKVNHIALNVDDSLEKTINKLKENSFTINTIGGEIKHSKDEMLHQGSTMSDTQEYTFKTTKRKLPGCFVEFVHRDKFPGGSIREGFEANNALHIFDSTNNTSKSPNKRQKKYYD